MNKSEQPIVALRFPSPVKRKPPPCGCDWAGCPDCHPEHFGEVVASEDHMCDMAGILVRKGASVRGCDGCTRYEYRPTEGTT